MKRRLPVLTSIMFLLFVPSAFAAVNPFKPLYGILNAVFEFGSLGWVGSNRVNAVRFIYFIVVLTLVHHYSKSVIKENKVRSVVSVAVAALSVIYVPAGVPEILGNQYGSSIAFLLLAGIPSVICYNLYKKLNTLPDSRRKYIGLAILFLIFGTMVSSIAQYVGMTIANEGFSLALIPALVSGISMIAFVFYLVLFIMPRKGSGTDFGNLAKGVGDIFKGGAGVGTGLLSAGTGAVGIGALGMSEKISEWNKTKNRLDAARKNLKKYEESCFKRRKKFESVIARRLKDLRDAIVQIPNDSNATEFGKHEGKIVRDLLGIQTAFSKLITEHQDEFSLIRGSISILRAANKIDTVNYMRVDMGKEEGIIRQLSQHLQYLQDSIYRGLDQLKRSDANQRAGLVQQIARRVDLCVKDLEDYAQTLQISEHDMSNLDVEYKRLEAAIGEKVSAAKVEAKVMEDESEVMKDAIVVEQEDENIDQELVLLDEAIKAEEANIQKLLNDVSLTEKQKINSLRLSVGSTNKSFEKIEKFLKEKSKNFNKLAAPIRKKISVLEIEINKNTAGAPGNTNDGVRSVDADVKHQKVLKLRTQIDGAKKDYGELLSINAYFKGEYESAKDISKKINAIHDSLKKGLQSHITAASFAEYKRMYDELRTLQIPRLKQIVKQCERAEKDFIAKHKRTPSVPR